MELIESEKEDNVHRLEVDYFQISQHQNILSSLRTRCTTKAIYKSYKIAFAFCCAASHSLEERVSGRTITLNDTVFAFYYIHLTRAGAFSLFFPRAHSLVNLFV